MAKKNGQKIDKNGQKKVKTIDENSATKQK